MATTQRQKTASEGSVTGSSAALSSLPRKEEMAVLNLVHDSFYESWNYTIKHQEMWSDYLPKDA